MHNEIVLFLIYAWIKNSVDIIVSYKELKKGSLSSFLAEAKTSSKLFLHPMIAKTGMRNGNSMSGQYLPFGTFHLVYDETFINTGAIYGVEQGFGGRITLKVARSIGGGKSWTVIGSVPCNVSLGESIKNIYVEPMLETIYILKAININATPIQYVIES